ncbi:hypothetical protein LTR10_006843 [Elasticomyces elasticus]|nr:hypothetical protein LTR10_006843 [Elasticomyces elasticus]
MASTRTAPPGRSLRARIAYEQILGQTKRSNRNGSAALPTTRESPSGQGYGPVSATREYMCFDGTDATADATQWLPFNQLWSLNEPTILSKNGGDTYITHYIREAIEQVSCDGEVDASLVLAIVMQEVSQARKV